MKLTWLAFGLVPALSAYLVTLASPALGSQSGDAQHGRLTHVQPQAHDDNKVDEPKFDGDAWRKRLVASDLDQRQRDFEKLVRRARRDKDVRQTIEDWSHDTGNPDLAWTSRLLLREIDSAPARSGARGFAGMPGWNDLQSQFDELQRQFGGMDSTFGDLQQELDRLRHDALNAPHGNGMGPASPNGSSSSAQSFTLEVGPDGVVCRIRENVNGKEQTKEYKADSLDALLDAHPELRDRIQAGNGGFGWHGPLFSDGSRDATREDGADGSARRSSATPRTDQFGVEYSKPSAERLKELSLDPDRGLLVERTVPGSLARILGVKAGDLLIEMNGIPLSTGDDVHRALRDRAPDADLKVTLIDAKGQRRTLTWRPAPQRGSTHANDDNKDESRKG